MSSLWSQGNSRPFNLSSNSSSISNNSGQNNGSNGTIYLGQVQHPLVHSQAPQPPPLPLANISSNLSNGSSPSTHRGPSSATVSGHPSHPPPHPPLPNTVATGNAAVQHNDPSCPHHPHHHLLHHHHHLNRQLSQGTGKMMDPNVHQLPLENSDKKMVASISKAINSTECPVKQKHVRGECTKFICVLLYLRLLVFSRNLNRIICLLCICSHQCALSLSLCFSACLFAPRQRVFLMQLPSLSSTLITQLDSQSQSPTDRKNRSCWWVACNSCNKSRGKSWCNCSPCMLSLFTRVTFLLFHLHLMCAEYSSHTVSQCLSHLPRQMDSVKMSVPCDTRQISVDRGNKVIEAS